MIDLPTVEPMMLWLYAGVLGLLVAASLIGFVLARRVTTDSGRETVRNLNARIKAWWVMVLVFALAFVVVNVVVDLAYGALDPRISRRG